MSNYVSTTRYAFEGFDGRILLRCEIDCPREDTMFNQTSFDYLKTISSYCIEYSRGFLASYIRDNYNDHIANSKSRFTPFLYTVKMICTCDENRFVTKLTAALFQGNAVLSQHSEVLVFDQNGLLPEKLYKKHS